MVLFSSGGDFISFKQFKRFSCCLTWGGAWGASSAFQHCLSVKPLPLEIEEKKCPPPIQELCVYPGHLRSRPLIPELHVRLQGLHSLHSPATCPGAEVLLVHSPALHHYSKSYVLGEQIRAQRKIIHWPTESLELRLNHAYESPPPQMKKNEHKLALLSCHSDITVPSPSSHVRSQGLVKKTAHTNSHYSPENSVRMTEIGWRGKLGWHSHERKTNTVQETEQFQRDKWPKHSQT